MHFSWDILLLLVQGRPIIPFSFLVSFWCPAKRARQSSKGDHLITFFQCGKPASGESTSIHAHSGGVPSQPPKTTLQPLPARFHLYFRGSHTCHTVPIELDVSCSTFGYISLTIFRDMGQSSPRPAPRFPNGRLIALTQPWVASWSHLGCFMMR